MTNSLKLRNPNRESTIIITAGSNGSGKTTFAREFLPKEAECPVFVNADLIAAGLSPFDPTAAAVHAGRLMIEQIESHVRGKRSFALVGTALRRASKQAKKITLQTNTPLVFYENGRLVKRKPDGTKARREGSRT